MFSYVYCDQNGRPQLYTKQPRIPCIVDTLLREPTRKSRHCWMHHSLRTWLTYWYLWCLL